MPIAALPAQTVRLLGASLAITTPVALVKELVENSIDARATSIEVLITTNTIDKVEVRDNGQGIRAEDFDSLGRRGHTSKLRSFEELRQLGGTTLGFRGEALASVNTIGTVCVTTRTVADTIATVLHLAPNVGGVEKRETTSAPVGTSVAVTDLFSCLPVRKQCALKGAQSTLSKIKELLYSYALSRPRLRLSFRVLRKPNLSWSYSPRPDAGVREAALQIFGSDLTSHCLETTFSVGPDDEHKNAVAEGKGLGTSAFILEAFLPRPGAELSKMAATSGSFVSVDSRPILARRGTIKKMLVTFRTYLAKTQPTNAGWPRNPFIHLNIRCPIESYDPNVDPSKSDVLFADEQRVLEAFEALCSDVYGAKECKNGEGEGTTAGVNNERSPQRQDFPPTRNGSYEPPKEGEQHEDAVGALESAPPADIQRQLFFTNRTRQSHEGHDYTAEVLETQQPSQLGIGYGEAHPQQNLEGASASSSCGSSCEEGDSSELPSDSEMDGHEAPPRPLEGVNPWVIAKMVARRNPPRLSPQASDYSCSLRESVEGEEASARLPNQSRAVLGELGDGQSIQSRYTPPGADVPRRYSRLHYADPETSALSQERGGRRNSPLGNYLGAQGSPQRLGFRGANLGLGTPPPSLEATTRRHLPWQHPSPDRGQFSAVTPDGFQQTTLTARSGIPQLRPRRSQLGGEERWIADNNASPLTEGSPAATQHLRQTTLAHPAAVDNTSSGRAGNRSPERPRATKRRHADGVFSPLAKVSQVSWSGVGSSKQNRAAETEENSQTRSLPGDSRRHTAKRHHLNPGMERLRRFPSEDVIEHDQKHLIIETLDTSFQKISAYAEKMLYLDTYILSGENEKGLDLRLGTADLVTIEKRIWVVMSQWMKPNKWEGEFELDLVAHMKGKATEV